MVAAAPTIQRTHRRCRVPTGSWCHRSGANGLRVRVDLANRFGRMVWLTPRALARSSAGTTFATARRHPASPPGLWQIAAGARWAPEVPVCLVEQCLSGRS